jgi:hypothetical protein
VKGYQTASWRRWQQYIEPGDEQVNSSSYQLVDNNSPTGPDDIFGVVSLFVYVVFFIQHLGTGTVPYYRYLNLMSSIRSLRLSPFILIDPGLHFFTYIYETIDKVKGTITFLEYF